MSEIAKLYSKMSKVMGHLDRIEKRGHNAFFNYDFVTSDDVLDAVRKAMVAENLAFFTNLLNVEMVDMVDKAGKPKVKYVADFEFTIADCETGETLHCIWKGEAMDTEDKAISKCATSAEKYFLLKTFLIGTGDEPDPDSGDDTGKTANLTRPAKKQPQQKPQPKAPDEPMIPLELEHLAGIVTKDGTPYPLLSSEDLASHSIGIATALAKNGLTPDKRAEYEAKQAAIGEILAFRNNQ